MIDSCLNCRYCDTVSRRMDLIQVQCIKDPAGYIQFSPYIKPICEAYERKQYRCRFCDDPINYEGICDKCRKLRGEL